MEQRETAGVTIRLIIDLVRKECGEPGVSRLLTLTGESRPLETLENPRVWHSFSARRRFFEAGTEVTGDPDFAFRVGASVLSSRASVLLRMLFQRFGSPRNLLRALPVAQAKFDTACESSLLAQSNGHATVRFLTKHPYEPSPYDCRYAMGLFSQLPALFGMAPATVVQPRCQVDGAETCLFELSWDPRRLDRSARLARVALAQARAGTDLVEVQLEELEATVSDLLDTRDVDAVIEKVVEHAGSAVAAQQLLLAIRLSQEGPIEVRSSGLSDPVALQIGRELLGPGSSAVAAAGAAAVAAAVAPAVAPEGQAHAASAVAGAEMSSRRIVSDVRSPAHDYGKLVAFSSADFVDSEQRLLDAYARLAATALDATVALEDAAARRQTAEALGSYAARLIRTEDVAGIAAATAEAAQEIVGSDRAVVCEFSEADGAFRMLCHRGYRPDQAEALDQFVLTADDTPEFLALLSQPEAPRVYDRSTDDRYVQAVMDGTGVDTLAIVAIRSHERLHGALVSGWTGGGRRDLDELVRRLAGISHQAAGAWEKTRLVEQVHHQASIDTLTGCANRRVFTEMLGSLLSSTGGPPLAVLFCDLDRFKGVNDAFGHAAGDELLVVVARRLQHCVRSDDLVARLGGDEFTILLTDVSSDWSPEIFTAKVREAMSEPVEIEGTQVVIHLSIGAVVAVPGESEVKDVLRHADAAMYVAKARGGDRLLMFEDDMLLERSRRLELEASLARAVADTDQFVVLYQPQVDLASGRVVGAEALVRWEHPRLGLLTPDRFLSVAEETGFVVPMDLHVLRRALAEVASWHRAGLDLRVAVNFSARTLASPELIGELYRELTAAGVPGQLLEIELTESTAVSDAEALSRTLLAIGELGVTVAIDDVGTGYSSLALLHKLPAQRIKIDRSFVQMITEDAASKSVVEAVLLLADRLGQSVVAEGIESVDQALELKSLGCDLGQGYLFAKPGPADQTMALATTGVSAYLPW
jgi:diguanylate cyclase (GGDEF)-like protein